LVRKTHDDFSQQNALFTFIAETEETVGSGWTRARRNTYITLLSDQFRYGMLLKSAPNGQGETLHGFFSHKKIKEDGMHFE
jgi:hypothetical protein